MYHVHTPRFESLCLKLGHPAPLPPATISHSSGGDDAVLSLQQSFQARGADLEGEGPLAETGVSFGALEGPAL